MLTRSGRLVLGGGVVLYAAGVALGWPELVGLGGAALVVLAVCGLLVVVRPRLELVRDLEPDRVLGGEPALARLKALSRSRLPTAPVTAVDRVGDRTVEVALSTLPPGGRRTVRYALPTPRRGRLVVGPLVVERRDPLGLLRRGQPVGGRAVLWALPRSHPLPVLPVGTLLDQEGPLQESSPRGSVTFSSLREYVAGDDPRLVHWRSTARTGQLMVRENVDTSQPTTTVALDTRRASWPADPDAGLDDACEVAASVVASVRGAGRPVALHAVGEDVAAASAAGARDLLDRLAALALTDEADPAAVAHLAERALPGGALVVVTGVLDEATLARLSRLRRRFAPVVVVQVLAGEPTRAERAAGLTIVRAADSAAVAAGWRSLLSGGRT